MFSDITVEGVGYATVQDILTGKISTPRILLLIFVAKLSASSLTVGSGGIFSPSLCR
jgi:CIC family chloride channel protein